MFHVLNKKSRHNFRLARGQAMLIAVIVLSAVMFGFAFVGAVSFIRETQNSLAYENKLTARAAAQGCLESAIDRLGRNAAYAGNEILTMASSTCTIRPVTSGGGIWTLEAWSQVGDQIARFRTVLGSRKPVVINSWEEVASF